MEMVRPCVTIIDKIDGDAFLKKLEEAARTCYQSPSNDETREQFLRNIIKNGHTSVIEHISITAKIICDRGVSHELVRHRLASYSQESTRYVNYNARGMKFIRPITLMDNPELFKVWEDACKASEVAYCVMIENGATPQEARHVLNHSVKTEIVVTMNPRSLRNFFEQRCAKSAHPHIKEIAIPYLLFMQERVPVIFDDIGYDEVFYNKYIASKGENWHDYVIDRELMEECGLV